MELMRRRRGIMGLNGGAGIPVIIATATGNPLSFTTDMVRPLKSLVVPFSMVQEGTGDPSPENERSISGWTGCEIQHSTNVWDNSISVQTGKYVDGQGNVDSYPGWVLTDFVPVFPSTKYHFNPNSSSGQLARHAFYNQSKGKISTISSGEATFTTPSNCYYMRFSYRTSSTNIVLEQIDSPIQISWQTEAGIMYDGMLTVNDDGNGKITRNTVGIILNGTEDWQKFGSGSASAFAMKLSIPAFVNQNNAIVASYLKTISKDATWGNYDNWVSWANPNVLATGIRSITTVKDWKTYLSQNPLTVVYKRSTPATIQLTNIQVLTTLKGDNAIWTDTNGTNTATYLKHQTT